MSDENEHGVQRNPFIRFKNHVNHHIRTSFNLVAGTGGARGPSHAVDFNKHSPDSIPAQRPHHTTCSPSQPWRRPSRDIECWHIWCHTSPYSPHNLLHLPQPTPRDLTFTADPASFGVHEAFEDLMSVTSPSGGWLMDLGHRSLQNMMVPSTRATQEPWCWVRRLHDDNLPPPAQTWDASNLTDGFLSPRRGALPAHEPDKRITFPTFSFLDALGAVGIADLYKTIIELKPDSKVADTPRKLRDIGKNQPDASLGDSSGEHGQDSPESHGDVVPASAHGDEPDTEEELFQMMHAVLPAAFRTRDVCAAATADNTSSRPERARGGAWAGNETEEHGMHDGGTVTPSTEHSDLFGRVHTKTEVTRFNARGEITGHSSTYSVRTCSGSPVLQQQKWRGLAGGQGTDQDGRRAFSLDDMLAAALGRETHALGLVERADRPAQKVSAQDGQANTQQTRQAPRKSGWFWR